MRKYSEGELPIANIAVVARVALRLAILAGQLGKLEEFTKIGRNLGK